LLALVEAADCGFAPGGRRFANNAAVTCGYQERVAALPPS
jgi:hypothetical protein